MSLASILLDPLSHGFMQRGLVAALLVAMAAATLSCFLVLRGWALMGDAISHAVLPGIVAAHVLAMPLTLGAFLAGLFCAFSAGYLRAKSRVREDAMMAIVFSGMFALGLVLFLKIDTDQHLTHILFGNMLGLSWRDVGEIALIALPTVLIVLAKRRDFVLAGFDPAHARAIGLSIARLDGFLLTLLALSIVAAMKAVGVVLVIAMLIAPGAIGVLLTHRFDRMLAIAISAAMASSLVGLYVSFYIDAATGPTIVVLQSLIVVAAVAWRVVRNARASPLRNAG
ncbi:MAG: metal ABC transporter permease [Rhizobiales bacterium]|nr:metal ABC transporter permease [Hyphomicrobiales bacterium]